MHFVRDLFMGPGNKSWDLARILGAKAFCAFTFAFLYALVWLGSVPDWSALGVGYTGVLGGIAMLIMGKDFSTTRANAIVNQQPPAPAAPTFDMTPPAT